MAIDSRHVTFRPLKYCNTGKISAIMVYYSWIAAIFFFIFSYQEIMPNIWECSLAFEVPYGEKAYVTWYSITAFLLPTTILLYTYVGICIGIWKSNNKSEINAKKYDVSENFFQQKLTVFAFKASMNNAKVSISLISFYLITRTPCIGCLLWVLWNPKASFSSSNDESTDSK
ncbi:PREDICTED: isotocin receptor-like [Dufourea novaeangliae]|uniref:isotocin receptor-like n=1 Tax=Dufourea novaeangliae TaxID=178035 RepID=UPI0007674E44|nr:PREDICTED: isotocin receptor-like [Dufourea novaeangliae]